MNPGGGGGLAMDPVGGRVATLDPDRSRGGEEEAVPDKGGSGAGWREQCRWRRR